MNDSSTHTESLTICDFVIGLVTTFVDKGARGIVAPEIDTRHDEAARAAYERLDARSDGLDVRFHVATNLYGESTDWRHALYHFGSTLFRPVNDHGVLYFDRSMVRSYAETELVGDAGLWRDATDAFIERYYELPAQWTVWTDRIGYPNFPGVIGALDTRPSDFM